MENKNISPQMKNILRIPSPHMELLNLPLKSIYFFIRMNTVSTILILRYANVYGPRQNPFGEAGVVAIFANKLLKNENPIINGEGIQTRDYVFVEDVVKANVITLSSDTSNIFNVGTEIETSVNQLFEKLNRISGDVAVEKHGPAPKGEQLRSVITSDKLFKEFKWKPSVIIDEGLKKDFDSFNKKM